MIRVDLYLVKGGFVSGRDAAKRLIAAGGVLLDGAEIRRPSETVDETLPHEVVLPETGQGYASRGGLKLEAALDASGLSPAGLVALDIGASGGGFTDCLLRRGAESVYALDNGHGQLADFLARDPRVTVMEGYNARNLRREDFPIPPRFVTMDVSFISQTLILPALAGILDPGAVLVSLVKPQFEVGRAGVGRGGIVKDPALRRAATEKVVAAAKSFGFSFLGSCVSPILGGDGNEEYLVWFSFHGNGKDE